MLHIKLNGITKYSNFIANILPADPPPPPQKKSLTLGSKGLNSMFSKHGHVAYEI